MTRITRAEGKLNLREKNALEIRATYEDGHNEIIDIITALCGCIGIDDKPPGKRLVHVEPFGESVEESSLYESLKQLVGEWKYIGECGNMERIERDGRTDPPFNE